jgi:hypothetical protein
MVYIYDWDMALSMTRWDERCVWLERTFNINGEFDTEFV